MSLSADQTTRYARQLFLDEVGGAGQRRLLETTVAITGDGLAAQECATYLAGAGVGALAISAATAERIGSHLTGLNPDTRWSIGVPETGSMTVNLTDTDDDSRLLGARAALRVLVAVATKGNQGLENHP